MSSDKVSFNELTEAGEVKPGDFFIVENLQKTEKVNFSNIIFGLENVTFGDTIINHSTSILELSGSIASLSGDQDLNSQELNSLLTTAVQLTTAAYLNQIYPVGSILYTITDINPQVTILDTAWQLISEGLFIAGVGTSTDINNVGFTVEEGTGGSNFSFGEYNHLLTLEELAKHSHEFTPINGDNVNIPGIYAESAVPVSTIGNQPELSPTISSLVGGGEYHNNIPPLFGVYVWQRIT